MKKLLLLAILGFGSASAFGQTTQTNPDSIPFAPPVNYGTGSGGFVFCADLDDDQDLDLAVANQYDNNISVLLNDGDGTFQAQVDYEVNPGPHSIFCADLDGDLDLDLAVSHAQSLAASPVYTPTVSTLFNNGDGTYQVPVNYTVGDSNRFIFCDDLDGDSDLDLAVIFKDSNSGSDSVGILLNNGDGTFQSPATYPTGNHPISVFCADLDSDLYSDLVVGHLTSGPTIFFNNGDGTFQAEILSCPECRSTSVFCADLDADSDLDLAVTTIYSGVAVLLNSGDGTFQSAAFYAVEGQAWFVSCGDLDGDSDLDLTVARWYSGISILLNNGDGTFQSAIDYEAETNPVLASGEDMDLTVANQRGGNAPQYPDISIFCADLDGDLDLDIAATNQGGGTVSVFMNLTQVPGNSPPYPFSLLLPESAGVLCDSITGTGDSVAYFDWAAAFDPNLSDQVTYDLYISTSDEFPPGPQTIIDSNLTVRQQSRTLPLDCYFWKVKAKDSWGAERWSTETRYFMVGCGDPDNNCHVDIGDLVYLVNYLYKQGPEPVPVEAGDVNDDGILNIADIVYLISYLYRSGSPPCSPP